MKNNAPRNSIFNCRRPLSVLLLGVVVPHAQVNADVPPPPPVQHQNAGFPSAQKLEQMGYNRETGVWKVQTNPTGKPTVSSGGGQITGTQGQRVTVTDRYGNKATVNTQVTQRVNSGRVEAAIGGTLAGLTAAGGAIGSDFAASAYKNAKEGDWGGFARDSFGAVLEGLSKLDFTGLGGGINQFLDKTGIREGASAGQLNQASAKAAAAQAQAERAGDFRAAVANAAAAKAAQGAAGAVKKAEAEKKAEKEANAKGLYRYDIVLEFSNNKNGKYYKNYVAYSTEKNDRAWGRVTVSNISWWNYSNRDSVTFWLGQHFTPKEIEVKVNVPKDTYTEINLRSYPAGSPDIPDAAKNAGQVNQSDFVLNQKEMLDILKRMLENNQTNHAELMNQLAKMGNVVPDSTTSTEFTPATATTAPYTPSGSNTPQQTQITINRDGSMTTSIIPRNDLVPNSPQAPTRSALIPNNP
ncbi:virulence factor TspB C-terminal domain-related protein, partial [Neisseria cinerea]|uniref:virulence factor TspB C-terminal domain-related protein n=1 Tax=Neisseria cinerea TaxID=483 RepID=UPI003C7D12B6